VEERGDKIRVTAIIPGGTQTGYIETCPEQNTQLPDLSTL
jgi:hypothetical protein